MMVRWGTGICHGMHGKMWQEMWQRFSFCFAPAVGKPFGEHPNVWVESSGSWYNRIKSISILAGMFLQFFMPLGSEH